MKYSIGRTIVSQITMGVLALVFIASCAPESLEVNQQEEALFALGGPKIDLGIIILPPPLPPPAPPWWTKPLITSISPPYPKPGDLITIRGRNFGDQQMGGSRSSWVRVAAQPFNDRPVVTYWSDRKIIARLNPNVVGNGELSVMVEGFSSLGKPLYFDRGCAESPDFEMELSLPNSVTSIPRDLVTKTGSCQIAVVGKTTDFQERTSGYLYLSDEQGNALHGSPYLYRDVEEWRSIMPTMEGYLLVGTTQSKKIAMYWVDDEGNTIREKVYDVLGTFYVKDAVKTMSEIAVVGNYGGRSGSAFLAIFDVEGNIVDRSTIAGNYSNPKTATAVAYVDNAFAVAGNRQRWIWSGFRVNRQNDGWIAKYSAIGDHLGTRYNNTWNNRFNTVTKAPDGVLAAGNQITPSTRGLSSFYSWTPLSPIDKFPNNNIANISASETLRRGILLAGAKNGDGRVALANDIGEIQHWHEIDLGAEDTINAVAAIYGGPLSVIETGYYAVGTSRVGSLYRSHLVRRSSMYRWSPEVEFTVENGPDTEIDFQVSTQVTLRYDMEDAGRYEIRKLGGAGPEPDVVEGTTTNGSLSGQQTLQFYTPEILACANDDGCGATVYEISVFREGGLFVNTPVRATVSVFVEMDAATQQLVTSSSVLIEQYGRMNPDNQLTPAHNDSYTNPGRVHNRCFSGMGLPYASVDNVIRSAPSGTLINDRLPGLLMYDSDANGMPTRLSVYGLGTVFGDQRPTIEGRNYTVPSDWEGHFGGWHTGDGGMAIVTPDVVDANIFTMGLTGWVVPPFIPPAVCFAPNGVLRDVDCGAKPPLMWHPALWDLHIVLPPDGGVPTVAFTTNEAGVDDPCDALTNNSPTQPMSGCDTGSPSLNINPFFTIDAQGDPIQRGCN